MEDIFKTENRLMKRLIALNSVLSQKTIREILCFIDDELHQYSINNVSSEYMVSSRVKVIEMYQDEKAEGVKNLLAANELLKKHQIFPGDVFTDPNDTEKSIYEYDYYFRPRTKTQYDREETEARAGINGKYPMDSCWRAGG